MKLLVDAGNTRIKWRAISGRELLGSGVESTQQSAKLAQVWQPFRQAEAVVSCVAGAAVQAALHRILAGSTTSARWLQPEREKYGLINLYDRPEQLGADRYAGLIAASRMQVGNCVVVSIGTATTVDMLNRDHVFLGGIIMPGPDLMRAALLGGTGQIASRMGGDVDALAGADPASLPRNTDAAVGMGIALAQAGAVDAMCRRMAEVEAEPPLVILSGGARASVMPWLSRQFIEIEDLVLEGLAWVAQESP